jgi:hypothetical protein
MADNIEIIRQGDYLHVTFSGAFSFAAAKCSIDAIVNACEEERCSSVLFDCRPMTGEMSIVDRYEIGQHGARIVPPGIKIAMLGREDQILPDKFLETVADNRGLILRVFSDENEATEWLKV